MAEIVFFNLIKVANYISKNKNKKSLTLTIKQNVLLETSKINCDSDWIFLEIYGLNLSIQLFLINPINFCFVIAVGSEAIFYVTQT